MDACRADGHVRPRSGLPSPVEAQRGGVRDAAVNLASSLRGPGHGRRLLLPLFCVWDVSWGGEGAGKKADE